MSQEKRVSINKLEKIARTKFGYKQIYIDGEKLSYCENMRDSVIESLVNEYKEIRNTVFEIQPQFLFLKEALLIRHFTICGLEKLDLSKKNDIVKLINGTNDLYDITLESEGIKYLNKIMTLFSKSDIDKIYNKLKDVVTT
ncbi:hypothetical protein [Paenibacillus tianjinensis]|uniref:Uncharacterized protein n=1 Tax=Paenibacillus tianjinensis TaxID=2810347 RepID=A0ABX7L5S7_9BACL|nr:hypothetical protein [Paenibacillus tianjinensis]QSF43269.1 hypothetical protein JRJ22_18555 [Paenibacillus tianjinensis]